MKSSHQTKSLNRGSFKVWFIILIIVIIVAAIWLIFQPKLTRTSSSSLKDNLTLTNLPKGYCPISAQVIDQKYPANGVTSVTVNQCQTISLTDFTKDKSGAVTLAIKFPLALAFEVVLNDPYDQSINHALSIGDVNSDNIIDGTDELLIKNQLFKDIKDLTFDQKKYDLDNDGVITVVDLSFTKINRGVGILKGDGQPWDEGAQP